MPGLNPGTVFRTRFKKEMVTLHEEDNTVDINRFPVAALNNMLGCEYFRSPMDLIFTNRETPEAETGFVTVVKQVVDGGVSCLGLEMGNRFPYVRPEGVVDSVCIRRKEKLIPRTQLRLMEDPLFFNLLAASYLQC